MANIEIIEKQVDTAIFQFVFPFSLKKNCQDELCRKLNEEQFKRFLLNDTSLETLFYGEGYSVSNKNLQRFFLPFAENVLFPHEDGQEGFRRFSKAIGLDAVLETKFEKIPFRVHSLDVFLCSFDIGFLTIRTELTQKGFEYSTALDFANRFRVLEDINPEDSATSVIVGSKAFLQVEDFVFNELSTFILPYLDKSEVEGAYFETLPYFVDERMYVIGTVAFTEEVEIDVTDQFRASRLDGRAMDGRPMISSSNPAYVAEHCRVHRYDRWGPNTIYIADEQAFCCLTNNGPFIQTRLANMMYGEYYYSLLLNMFHKMVLLKLSNRYSYVQLEKNSDEIKALIREITTFSAKFYFVELATQSQGKDIFILIRRFFSNEALFSSVKATLIDLFKYQERNSAKRTNSLLLIFTIYTVISGIYGMNQVIEDLKGDINWSKMLHYSLFEYIALFVVGSGILVVGTLAVDFLLRMIREWRKKL